MKYKERDELVNGLRELADFLETDAGLELPITYIYGMSLVSYFYSDGDGDDEPKAKMIQAVKALGKCDKLYSGDYFRLSKSFGPHVKIKFETQRSHVCTKKIVSTKKVPKRVVVDIPGEFEDVHEYEYECEPL